LQGLLELYNTTDDATTLQGIERQAEWLAFLLRIREVHASNLGPETSYHEFFIFTL
jgi:hypothetical protein